MSQQHLDKPFFDNSTGKLVKFTMVEGEIWIVWKHPDGQWVTLRRPTGADYFIRR